MMESWQQVSQDSLRAVLDSVFAGPPYRWVERPDPLAVVRKWFVEVSRWLAELRDNNPIGFRVLLAALVALLVVILIHAGWVLVRTIRPATGKAGPPAPAIVRRDRAWYLREADRLAADGRFVEAMQVDFLALVLALDASRALRFHPAKTPREYLNEPALPAEERTRLRGLVSTLYGHAFARWPCGPGEFAAWRKRLGLDAVENHAASG